MKIVPNMMVRLQRRPASIRGSENAQSPNRKTSAPCVCWCLCELTVGDYEGILYDDFVVEERAYKAGARLCRLLIFEVTGNLK